MFGRGDAGCEIGTGTVESDDGTVGAETGGLEEDAVDTTSANDIGVVDGRCGPGVI